MRFYIHEFELEGERDRSMENKRDSEIDGCYIVEGILFRVLPHHLSHSLVTIPQKIVYLSVRL